MQLTRPLRLAAAFAAAAVSFTALGAAPALAARPSPVPIYLGDKPASLSSSTTAYFTWTGGPTGATFTCALDGARAVTCDTATSQTYTNLADGSHTFVVRAKAKGKPSTASYRWTVNAVPPAKPSVAAVPSPTSSTWANISFTNSDPTAVRYTCQVDDQAPVDCSSPWQVTGLAAGVHTAYVVAFDQYGLGSGPASTTWEVDLAAPANVYLVGPKSPTNADSVTAEFSSPDAASFTCSVDNATPYPCTSPLVLPGLSEGAHFVTVIAYDSAGNASRPMTAVWTIDRTPPAQPTIQTGPADPTNETTAHFVLGNVDSSATLVCVLNGVVVDCPLNMDFTVPVGANSFGVYAVDAAGNQSATSSWSWTVSSDPAVLTPAQIFDGPDDLTNNPEALFSFDTADPDALGFRCSLDGAPYVDCESGWTEVMEPGTDDGAHEFNVVAVYDDPTDASTAVLVSAPAPWRWTLDTVAPAQPFFSTTPAAGTTETTAEFAFGSTEVGATFTCALDGAAAVPCVSPATYRDLAIGDHSLVVVAHDGAGNTSQARHDWTIVPASTPTDPGTGADPGTGTGTGTGSGTTSPSAPTAPPAPSGTATTASVTPNSALRGVSTVAFSGAVRGVPTSAVQLRVAGTTSNLAVGLSCADAAGAKVDCVANGVRKVSVQPAVALVPGQSYTLAVAGVTDTAGTAVAAASAGFRASTSEQESSLRAGYLWKKARTASAYGKSYLTEQRAKATVTVPFRGKKVTWYTMTGPTQGVAKVYVDGVRKARVNNYAAANHWRVARTIKGLKAGKHQLRIVVTGRKGATAGKGTSVVLDAVRAGRTLVKNPKAVTTWRTAKATTASGSAYAVANLRGTATSFTFRGTSVSWVTQTSPAMGKAKVYVDGVLKGTVDNFSKRSKWNVRRTVSGLSDAQHTVKLVVTGSKRKAAKGTDVVLDRWLVG